MAGLVGALLFCATPAAFPQAFSVNGSQAPGTIFVAQIEFGQLLPPVTIFFGAGPVPAAPTPTTITHALGNPVNERGFIWPKANFVVFGGNVGFFTTGTGALLFSSPSPAVDVVGLYSVTPAAGAFVGSIGYAFPGSSPDQAHGTYNETISLNAVQLPATVTFTLQWRVVPRFRLILTPITGGRGNFGSVAFGEAPTNQEFFVSTETNEGERYIITVETSGITNEFGTELGGVRIFSDGLSGNNLRQFEIPIRVATLILANQEIVIYRSNSDGNSDFFRIGIAIEPPFGQQAGTYVGTLTFTMTTL